MWHKRQSKAVLSVFAKPTLKKADIWTEKFLLVLEPVGVIIYFRFHLKQNQKFA